MRAVVFEAEGTLLRSFKKSSSDGAHAAVISGAHELLPILRRLGIKVAVLATTEAAERFERSEARQYVQSVVVSNARSIDPAKRGLTQALAELHATPEQSVMVSNRVLDIMVAKKGHLAKTVGVSCGDGNPQALTAAGADYIISDMPSLLDVLE